MSRVLARSGDRDVAYEEFRMYTIMLLSAAPVLIYAQARAGRLLGHPTRRRAASAQVRVDPAAPEPEFGDAVGRSRR